jgi:hypothetical protein
MSLEVKGKVIFVGEIKNGVSNDKNWTSQDFVIETSGEYPKKVCLNCFKKPTPKLGENVNVFFEPESREFNGKWFTTLKVWKFEVEGVTTQPQQSPQQTITPSQPDILPKEDEGNELPF